MYEVQAPGIRVVGANRNQASHPLAPVPVVPAVRVSRRASQDQHLRKGTHISILIIQIFFEHQIVKFLAVNQEQKMLLYFDFLSFI